MNRAPLSQHEAWCYGKWQAALPKPRAVELPFREPLLTPEKREEIRAYIVSCSPKRAKPKADSSQDESLNQPSPAPSIPGRRSQTDDE